MQFENNVVKEPKNLLLIWIQGLHFATAWVPKRISLGMQSLLLIHALARLDVSVLNLNKVKNNPFVSVVCVYLPNKRKIGAFCSKHVLKHHAYSYYLKSVIQDNTVPHLSNSCCMLQSWPKGFGSKMTMSGTFK